MGTSLWSAGPEWVCCISGRDFFTTQLTQNTAVQALSHYILVLITNGDGGSCGGGGSSCTKPKPSASLNLSFVVAILLLHEDQSQLPLSVS